MLDSEISKQRKKSLPLKDLQSDPFFSSNLKKFRQYWDLKQEDLALKIGKTKQTVSSYETGRRQPDFITLKKIAEVLSVTTDELIGHDSSEIISDEERKLIGVFRELDESKQNMIVSLLNNEVYFKLKGRYPVQPPDFLYPRKETIVSLKEAEEILAKKE